MRRVARGSGHTEKDIAELLQRFAVMQKMLGSIGQQAGLLQKLPGMKQLAMAKRLRDAVSTGGMDNPMMSNLATELLEAAVSGGGPGAGAGIDPNMFGALPPGMAGMLGMGSQGVRKKPMDPGKRKQQRKNQKKARKKSRR